MSFEIKFDCPLPNGIHARPASALAEVCEPFEVAIELENLRNGECAQVRSVLSMISADVLFNDSCRIVLEGVDEKAAHAALDQFIKIELPFCDDESHEVNEDVTVKLPRSLLAGNPDYIQGITVNGGIAEGVPMILGDTQYADSVQKLVGQGVEHESQLIGDGLQSLVTEMTENLHAVTASGDQTAQGKVANPEASILNAHLAIAKDEELKNRLLTIIEEGETKGSRVSAAQAIIIAVEFFKKKLGDSKSLYMQERALDIQDVGRQLMQHLYGAEAVSSVKTLAEPSVLIATNLLPSDFIALNNKHLKGLVLEHGGKTSHTMILARAAGLPVITGVEAARTFCANADSVVLDADIGILLRNPQALNLRYYQMEKAKAKQMAAKYEGFRKQDARTDDGKRVEIAANIALAEEAKNVFYNGAEGIGLFRTEMLFMDRDAAPSEQEQYLCYREVLQAADGKPVIIRTFDVGGDKPISYFGIGAEDNPFLGYRAVRTYPEFIEIFTNQLRALVRASVHGDLRIMIPMISCVEEMQWVRETTNQVIDELQQSAGSLKLGMMLEVPSAAFVIDQLAQYADFFSIGSNDLAQYFLACDRGNKRMASLYSNYHPSFIRLLYKVINDAKKANRWVGLCGEMGADDQLLPVLIGLGVDEISMAAPDIAQTKAAIAALNHKDCTDLLRRLMDCGNVEEVQMQLSSFRLNSRKVRPLLDESLILTDCDINSRAEAIKLLADNLTLQGRTDRSMAVEEALWQREEIFSTGLGFGIAIPHCKSEYILHNSVALLRLQNPIDWGSSDGEMVDTVFSLTMCEADAADVHMKVFAKLARKITHESFRDELKTFSKSSELLNFLTKELELV